LHQKLLGNNSIRLAQSLGNKKNISKNWNKKYIFSFKNSKAGT